MKVKIFVFQVVVCGLLMAVGCQRRCEPRADDLILNAPASREEGGLLMRTIEQEAYDRMWSVDEERALRRRMTSRLVSAGFSVEEIEQWCVASLSESDQTIGEEEL
jgi:hypothetical protein